MTEPKGALSAQSQGKGKIQDGSQATQDPQPASNIKTRGPAARRGEVRARILSVARERFLENGYNDTTMTEIARQAGCSPAMVTYYFESKQKLYRECLDLPIDPVALVLETFGDGPEGAGERAVRHALSMYEDELTADTMRALAQELLTDSATNQRFRQYLADEVFAELGRALGIGDVLAEELEFALATMFGVVTMRYVVGLEPIASMPRERLVRELAPVIQYRIDRAHARGRKRS